MTLMILIIKSNDQEAMPTNMEIIRDEVDKDHLRHVASAPKWEQD